MTAAATPSSQGRVQIGRYVVLGKLGRGGMGMVYQALDEALDREVALKILTAEGLKDTESRRRFAVEAKAAAQLQHPNIVTIFELGEQRGIPFIAMEYLPGIDLESLLRSGEQVLLSEKLETMVQVCRGLSYAHERCIVHRDIKPSNIRLLDDGAVKIMDFGIAKLGGVNLTQSGMVVGTVHYMSPEQVRGRPLDGRSDVFSVGVVLYELLAGCRPFDGGSATEILFKIVHAPTPPLPTPSGDPWPERLEPMLKRALAKEPTDRCASAMELADELAEIQAGLADAAPQTAERVLEAISGARRMLREGKLDEGIAHLDAVTRAHPLNVEARRALRSARRQKATTDTRRLTLDDASISELAATFQLPSTRRETEAAPAGPSPRPAARGRRGLAWAAAGLALLSVFVGLSLLLLRGESRRRQRLLVRSEPTGARILLGGEETGVVTDGELLLAPAAGRVELTFRKEGYADELRTVTLPLGENAALAVKLAAVSLALSIQSEPVGATVTLDGTRQPGVTPMEIPLVRDRSHRLVLTHEGYLPLERDLPAGLRDAQITASLSPVGPPAIVNVTSTYPLDVLWNGKALARDATAPRVSLPPGRHTLTLLAPKVALRASVSVEARPGAAVAVAAPGLGRLNAQAQPDNCEILIDGVFLDYPPIRDRLIAAGAHRIEFRWPGGQQAVEAVEVVEGRSVFVTGRPQ